LTLAGTNPGPHPRGNHLVAGEADNLPLGCRSDKHYIDSIIRKDLHLMQTLRSAAGGDWSRADEVMEHTKLDVFRA
jgi:hypothetical protein